MDKPLLKSCKACGTEISRHTPFCRRCGHPQRGPLILWIAGGFLLLLVGIYLGMAIYCLCNAERFRVYGPEHERGIEYHRPAEEGGQPEAGRK